MRRKHYTVILSVHIIWDDLLELWQSFVVHIHITKVSMFAVCKHHYNLVIISTKLVLPVNGNVTMWSAELLHLLFFSYVLRVCVCVYMYIQLVYSKIYHITRTIIWIFFKTHYIPIFLINQMPGELNSGSCEAWANDSGVHHKMLTGDVSNCKKVV